MRERAAPDLGEERIARNLAVEVELGVTATTGIMTGGSGVSPLFITRETSFLTKRRDAASPSKSFTVNQIHPT